MKLTFGCGHQATIGENPQTAPRCPACGSDQIRRVVSRPPRFRGCASGPYCETTYVEPATVNVARAGSLTLKPQES